MPMFTLSGILLSLEEPFLVTETTPAYFFVGPVEEEGSHLWVYLEFLKLFQWKMGYIC